MSFSEPLECRKRTGEGPHLGPGYPQSVVPGWRDRSRGGRGDSSSSGPRSWGKTPHSSHHYVLHQFLRFSTTKTISFYVDVVDKLRTNVEVVAIHQLFSLTVPQGKEDPESVIRARSRVLFTSSLRHTITFTYVMGLSVLSYIITVCGGVNGDPRAPRPDGRRSAYPPSARSFVVTDAVFEEARNVNSIIVVNMYKAYRVFGVVVSVSEGTWTYELLVAPILGHFAHTFRPSLFPSQIIPALSPAVTRRDPL